MAPGRPDVEEFATISVDASLVVGVRRQQDTSAETRAGCAAVASAGAERCLAAVDAASE